MHDSEQWILFEPQTYETPKFLAQSDINHLLENLKEANMHEVEVDLCFKNEHALKKFMQKYEEQMIEQEMMSYLEEDDSKEGNKFRKIEGFNKNGDYDVRQLRFISFHFLKVFAKIYQNRLKQMETEYHYKLQIWKCFLRVFYPKNQKISSFFKNQIFEMKTRLVLYYSNELQVVKKVKFSSYFTKRMESAQIAAMHRVNRQGIETAIFYSNVHTRKEILDFVNKNMLEHTTIINLNDRHLTPEANRNIFKLVASFLAETIKTIEKEQEIIVQTNFEKCCILVHDRHECHTDAKNQILQKISQMVFFKMDGKDMRSIFNQVIKNHKNYPYLRVKYSKRSLFCVFSHPIFHSSSRNLNSFCELFKTFFQNLNQENKLTYFFKNLKYPNFIGKILELTENNNLNVENFDALMLDERVPFSKIVLSVKALIGMGSVVETRKLFYEVFLKIMLRKDFVQSIVKNIRITADSFSNIMGLSKPSAILANDNNESFISQEEIHREFEALMQPVKALDDDSLIQTSISEESSGDKDTLKKKVSHDKREKRQKHIELVYPFKQPLHYPELDKFWETATRESKLQKALIKAHQNPFSKSKFKAFLMGIKQKLEIPTLEQLEQDRVYFSTTIQRQNKISYHLIDMEEFKKRENDSKMKHVFVFFKLKNQETYFPSFVLQFIQ